MNVLVADATRHGATAGIAERIAETLHGKGPRRRAARGGFAQRHRTALRQRPVWLFSSGPLGTSQVDEEHDVRE